MPIHFTKVRGTRGTTLYDKERGTLRHLKEGKELELDPVTFAVMAGQQQVAAIVEEAEPADAKPEKKSSGKHTDSAGNPITTRWTFMIIDARNQLTTTFLSLTGNGTQSSTFTSTALDVGGYVGKLSFSFSVGSEMTAGGGLIACRVESSGTDSGSGVAWAGVSSTGTLASITAAGQYNAAIATQEASRFVRVLGTCSGSTRWPVSVAVVGQKNSC